MRNNRNALFLPCFLDFALFFPPPRGGRILPKYFPLCLHGKIPKNTTIFHENHCESLGNISVDFLPRFLIIKKCTCNCTCRTDKYRHAYSTRYTIKNLGADTIVNESKMIVRGISETSSAFRRKVNTSLSVELISQACQLKSVNCEALSCNSYFFRILVHLLYCVGFN